MCYTTPHMGAAIRIEDDGAVRRLVLCRPAEFNTITPQLRQELSMTPWTQPTGMRM